MSQRVVLTWQLPTGALADSAGFADVGAPPMGQLIIDVSISEQYTKAAEVTTQPIETGSDATDNIRPLPDKVQIEGLVSNTPIGGVTSYMDGMRGRTQTVTRVINGHTVSFNVFRFDDATDRVKAVFGDLGLAVQSGAIFGLTTTLATYENMACTNFNVVRNAQNGNVLRFTMELTKLLFVETTTVAALPAKHVTQHRGAKTGKEAKDETKAKAESTAHAILKNLGILK